VVDVAAMVDRDDGDEHLRVADLVDDPVASSASREQAGVAASQLLPDAIWVVSQWPTDELPDGSGDRFGQPL
jgi:hypothetical protein